LWHWIVLCFAEVEHDDYRWNWVPAHRSISATAGARTGELMHLHLWAPTAVADISSHGDTNPANSASIIQ
jgi:hypothetical protein